MAVTLASLLSPQAQQELYAALLAIYVAEGFPVESWEPGGVERTRAMAITTAQADISGNAIPAIAAGGFNGLASGGWLDLLSQYLFQNTRQAATYTQGNITFTNSTSNTYSASAGKLIVVFGLSGKRYLNTGSVTIAANTTSVVAVQAENPGASYNDPSNSGSLTLVTPLPGVTLTNPASTYTGVTHTGSGTGTLTLGGSPSAPHSLILIINGTAATAPVSVSYELDGAPAVSLGSISSASNIGSSGINVTLTNGTGTSWVLNDTYSFNTPGSWITSQGANAETDTALTARNAARWPTLSSIPTQGTYQYLATSTPSVGAQVTQVVVLPDSVVNNKVNIIVAGPGGVLPGGVITAIQSYISPRARGNDNPVVQSPSTLAVTIVATITVAVAQLATAQVAINNALTNYVNGVGINGTLRISAIIDQIMNVAGVVDVSGVTINGSGSNLTLGSSTTFVLPQPLTLTLAYVTQ
jgi:uncharacterized phage protein gp47/JayE